MAESDKKPIVFKRVRDVRALAIVSPFTQAEREALAENPLRGEDLRRTLRHQATLMVIGQLIADGTNFSKLGGEEFNAMVDLEMPIIPAPHVSAQVPPNPPWLDQLLSRREKTRLAHIERLIKESSNRNQEPER